MKRLKFFPFIAALVLFICSINSFADTSYRVLPLQKNVFIKDWLLCGPFPNCDTCSLTDYKHDQRCKGYFTDYLTSVGGEEGVVPEAGMKVKVPSQNITREWFVYRSKTDHLPLNDIFQPNDLVIAYAFCQVKSPAEQKVILSVGSNDGIHVWLNGKSIHAYHPIDGRWLQKDNDFVPVVLKKGINNLLFKVDEGGGDFGLVARFLDYDSLVTEIRQNMDAYKRLSVVARGDTIVAQFGKPYKISVLNPTGSVLIELSHETAGKILQKKGAPGEDLVFDVAKVADGFMMIKATFPTPEDGVIVSEKRHFKGKLKRHPRPLMLNEDLMPLNADGQPFFPIGTYGAPPEDYAKLKDAGYNFVVAGTGNLDQVQQAGLMAAVPVHGNGATWFDAVRDTINKYKNHPAVLCWMLYDEPGYNRADLLDIYKIYNIAYDADPVHPSYLVITSPDVYETFGRCCDVLAVDTYPIANGVIESVGDNIARAYRVSDGDQPVWHCGQLFSWPAQRMPTPRENRFMTYLALIEGAKGVLWYTYKGFGQYLPEDDPVLWNAHKQLLRQLNDLAPLFIQRGFGTRISTTDNNPAIRAILKESPIGTFIIAVNTSRDKSFSAKFKLKVKQNDDIQVYGENRKLSIRFGQFKDRFQPLDVHIYKIP